jgi:hypothetical protein
MRFAALYQGRWLGGSPRDSATFEPGSLWPSEWRAIEHDLAPTGTVEEITMKRKRSLAKKGPVEVRLKAYRVVEVVDPPQLAVAPAEPEPEPEPAPEPGQERTEESLSGASGHLARALEIATAECARLAKKRAALAAELERANAQLLADGEEMQELRDRLAGAEKDIASFKRDVAACQEAHERDQADVRAAEGERNAAEARARELEGTLRRIDSLVSSALPMEEDTTE